MTPVFLLLLAALVSFLCATFNAPARINLTALGLAFLTGAMLLTNGFATA